MRPVSVAGLARALVRPVGIPYPVHRALFEALFSNAHIAHFLAAVVALFLAVFAWRELDVALAPYWLVVMLVLEGALSWLTVADRSKSISQERFRNWTRAYVALNHTVSILWGLAAWLFFVPELWVESLLVVVLLAGMLAGAILPFSHYFPLYLVLGLCIGLPLTARMALHAPEQPVYGALAVVLAVVVPALLRLSWSTFNHHLEELLNRVSVTELMERADAGGVDETDNNVDALTGVSNLGAFLSRGRRLLDENGGTAQVLALDLDRFDLINRALGLSAGDYVLRIVAQRLSSVLNGKGVVARIAADEFAVFLPDHRAAGQHLPQVLLRAISRPVSWLGEKLVLSASVGVASMPRDANDVEAALQAAVSAMKFSKREHRGQIKSYSAELGEHERLEKRLEIELALSEQRGELFLAYQPRVRVSDGQVVGAEALARWDNEALGAVSPSDFIPVAEKTGQIWRIGAWVLRVACREAQQWPAPLTVAVNVSAVQFRDPAFADLVKRVLQETGLAPARLELEVTESAIMSSPERVRANMQRLRDVGVTLALDDFGTGYSSISHLRELLVDVVKLDRSFVSELDKEFQKRSIVRATVGLCRDLGIEVVAEGVERQPEAELLSEFGCDLAQGFLWSDPLTAEAFRAYIARDSDQA